MEYEAYEPAVDEYYDQACSAVYAMMFQGGQYEDSEPAVSDFADR